MFRFVLICDSFRFVPFFKVLVSFRFFWLFSCLFPPVRGVSRGEGVNVGLLSDDQVTCYRLQETENMARRELRACIRVGQTVLRSIEKDRDQGFRRCDMRFVNKEAIRMIVW